MPVHWIKMSNAVRMQIDSKTAGNAKLNFAKNVEKFLRPTWSGDTDKWLFRRVNLSYILRNSCLSGNKKRQPTYHCRLICLLFAFTLKTAKKLQLVSRRWSNDPLPRRPTENKLMMWWRRQLIRFTRQNDVVAWQPHFKIRQSLRKIFPACVFFL